mmetsp:Transcript_58407/g.130184  ORF Transcript_58407/g.130184 Transcript_58407/m.130184 type:complete len:98 (-) Transcript_58407:92-385(-)
MSTLGCCHSLLAPAGTFAADLSVVLCVAASADTCVSTLGCCHSLMAPDGTFAAHTVDYVDSHTVDYVDSHTVDHIDSFYCRSSRFLIVLLTVESRLF